jgi:hypothetical protein
VEYESAVIYFTKSRQPGFELETFVFDTMLSYYAPTICNQKTKLIGKGGQFTYTSTLILIVDNPNC